MNEGTKHDTGKAQMDLLPPIAAEEVAKVLTYGASKYGRFNWRTGFKWGRLLAAALRHIFAFIRGEDNDPETGLSHAAHAACCMLFLIEHQKCGLGEDDRSKRNALKAITTTSERKSS